METLYVGKIYRFVYTNYNGVTETRRVRIESLSFGSNTFHREPQWLLNGHCMDRNARRTFALNDIQGDTIMESM